MAASTPMDDDWEMVFIDVDGKVVSGEEPVAQRKDVNPVIEPVAVPQSKPKLSIETQAYCHSKRAKMQPKESTEKVPARSLLARPVPEVRPVLGCSIPSLAYNDPRLLSNRDARKQIERKPTCWSVFPSEPAEPFIADESATKTDFKVEQGFAQHRKETKASNLEQLMLGKGHSPQIDDPWPTARNWKAPFGQPLPPYFGREQGESSRSGAERKYTDYSGLMVGPAPRMTPPMLGSALSITPPPPRFWGEPGESSRSGGQRDNTPSPAVVGYAPPKFINSIQLAPNLTSTMSENVQAMTNLSLSGGSVNPGSAGSSSLEKKVSLRHDSAIIVLVADGRSNPNAMEKAKGNLEKTLSRWNVTFGYRNSFSSEEQGKIQYRHSVCGKDTEFVRIDFLSRDDRAQALVVLHKAIWNSEGPRMAARAWLFE